MIQIKPAESKDELQGILSLQINNVKRNLSTEQISAEGFVTLEHDIETLQLMASYEPQIIAIDESIVVGYALVMFPEIKDAIPVLKPMFKKLNEISYKSKKISESKYYVMGQICIDKDCRGKGLFAKLYVKHKEEFASRYDYCITEVSSSNIRSLRAHEKVGFENIHAYSDATDHWVILLLDLHKK